MFYDRFVELCRARGKSPAAVTRELGLNNSSPTAWKRGATPKGETLQKLADYFGVSVDYLLVDTWGIKAGGKIKAGGGIKSRYGIEAGSGIETGGPVEVGPGVFDSPESDGAIDPTARELLDVVDKMSESEMRVVLAMVKQMIAERAETTPQSPPPRQYHPGPRRARNAARGGIEGVISTDTLCPENPGLR